MTDNTVKSQAKDKADSAASKLNGVVIGMLSDVDAQGRPMVIFPGNRSELPIVARSTLSVTSDELGREVALMFEQGDPGRPILMGLIENHAGVRQRGEETIADYIDDANDASLELDGKHIDLKAEQQITLKCGKASITLTRAGKVIIRGAYLLNRSSGVNRIKGGSVQIN